MSLLIHAQASELLAMSLREQADALGNAVLGAMADAYSAAARRMIEESAREARAMAGLHRCSLDHAGMKGPTCPACKAPIAKR